MSYLSGRTDTILGHEKGKPFFFIVDLLSACLVKAQEPLLGQHCLFLWGLRRELRYPQLYATGYTAPLRYDAMKQIFQR